MPPRLPANWPLAIESVYSMGHRLNHEAVLLTHQHGNLVHDELLVTHPDAVVLHCKGQLYAGRLSGSAVWIPLATPDLVLLVPFLAGAAVGKAAQAESRPVICRLNPR